MECLAASECATASANFLERSTFTVFHAHLSHVLLTALANANLTDSAAVGGLVTQLGHAPLIFDVGKVAFAGSHPSLPVVEKMDLTAVRVLEGGLGLEAFLLRRVNI